MALLGPSGQAQVWEKKALSLEAARKMVRTIEAEAERNHWPPSAVVRRGADRLHPTMRSRMWQPGVSGNPTGRGGLYVECRRLAAEASPQAMRRLIELMEAEDERVSYMATVAVLDRSGVKPIDYDPAQDVTPPTWDPGALTPEERENLKAYLVKMVRKAKP